tara:strand:- start:1314 stop:1550 length:237 start_codon:yes stop_codon:yes gene_type:complete
MACGAHAGIYMTGDLYKAHSYARKHACGGCILVLMVEVGNCLHLDEKTAHTQRSTWADMGYDSVHAAENVLGFGPHWG